LYKYSVYIELLQFGHGQQQRTAWLLYHPSSRWSGEENEKKKAKTRGLG